MDVKNKDFKVGEEELKIINQQYNNMPKELNIWGKVEGENITLQIKGKDLETNEVTFALKLIPTVMVKLTKHKEIKK